MRRGVTSIVLVMVVFSSRRCLDFLVDVDVVDTTNGETNASWVVDGLESLV